MLKRVGVGFGAVAVVVGLGACGSQARTAASTTTNRAAAATAAVTGAPVPLASTVYGLRYLPGSGVTVPFGGPTVVAPRGRVLVTLTAEVTTTRTVAGLYLYEGASAVRDPSGAVVVADVGDPSETDEVTGPASVSVVLNFPAPAPLTVWANSGTSVPESAAVSDVTLEITPL